MFSLSIQCVPSMNITGGIYRWCYASNVQLLFCTLTTVIYPDVHVISKSQPTCGTAQKGPQLQAALFDLIDEDRGGPLTTPRQDACVARSSPVFVFRPEDPRDGPSPRLLLTLASLLLTSCLHAPSATGPKVVSPTVAPRSLGPIFGRGAASTPWAPSASRSATLRAGRCDSSRRSTVRVHL